MFLVYIVTLIPVLLWIFTKWPLDGNFDTSYSAFLSLGQITGFMGISLFSINLILSARLKFLENIFGGLNQVYKKHHLIGGFAFIFMMVHPMLLVFSRLAISFDFASSLVTIGEDFAVDLGIIAILLIMSLLIITFYAKLPYQIWRFTHQLTGIVYVVAVLHVFLVGSTVNETDLLWWYMFLLATLGVLSYLYRTIFFRFLVRRYKYTASKITKLNDKVVEITLTPQTDKRIEYLAGQFVFVSFLSNTVSNEIHPFSIASSKQEEIVIISKNEGDYTQKLMNLEVGATALVEGAFGRFSYKFYPTTNQVWIAGGIGITPFIGMAKALEAESIFNVDLYYCVKDESEKLDFPTGKVNLKLFTSKTMGHITANYVKDNSKTFENSEFFICGPTVFMKSLRSQLVKLGIRNSKIHTEEFSLD